MPEPAGSAPRQCASKEGGAQAQSHNCASGAVRRSQAHSERNTTMTPCITCSGPVPDLPGLDRDRAHCSTVCLDAAVAAGARRLLEEVAR